MGVAVMDLRRKHARPYVRNMGVGLQGIRNIGGAVCARPVYIFRLEQIAGRCRKKQSNYVLLYNKIFTNEESCYNSEETVGIH